MKQWGENIERGRKALGLTQVQLAEAVGVTQQTVSSWETGDSAPRDRLKVRLADVLRQEVRSLFPLTRSVVAS